MILASYSEVLASNDSTVSDTIQGVPGSNSGWRNQRITRRKPGSTEGRGAAAMV